MYHSLDIFQTSAQMARHAGARQALTAKNVANVDTPGYAASHIASFADSYQTDPATLMRATRPGHIGAGQTPSDRLMAMTSTEPSPNGNAVSIEEEMLNAVAISREHDRALAIYRHAMTVLRTTLGR